MKFLKGLSGFFRYIAILCGTIVLLLVFGDLLLWGVKTVRHKLSPKSAYSYFAQEEYPVYDPYREELHGFFKEISDLIGRRPHFEPYYHWKANAFYGDHVNIGSDYLRKTVKNPNAGAKRVFMFGGSTMWGSGVPDTHTIPSQVQKILGPDYDVYNFGESGFVSVQELNLLLARLAAGDLPDYVIFYDGVNDGLAGVYSPGIPRDPQSLRMEYKLRDRSPLLYHLVSLFKMTHYAQFINVLLGSRQGNATLWDKRVIDNIESNVEGTLDAYEHFMRQARAIARSYGFNISFFWQPFMHAECKDLLPYEQDIFDRESRVKMQGMQLLYQRAKERFEFREEENLYFLGDIFKDNSEPIYIDSCHLGPEGNEQVAWEILSRLGLLD